MKHGLSHTLAIVGLGLATFAVTPARAQTTAPGPYYATPSWDQQLPAATRFIVLSNWNSAAVLDRETGLVWERVPSTSSSNSSWVNALRYCLALTLGGRRGWRLPVIQELQSLVDLSASNPVLPSGHPFTVQLSVYWSATEDVTTSFDAYGVSFANGQLGAWTKEFSDDNRAWCVRGGPGFYPQ